jgi:hypothetical protein
MTGIVISETSEHFLVIHLWNTIAQDEVTISGSIYSYKSYIDSEISITFSTIVFLNIPVFVMSETSYYNPGRFAIYAEIYVNGFNACDFNFFVWCVWNFNCENVFTFYGS